MKVLWITNIAMPPLCNAMGWSIPVSGGWMYSSLKRIIDLDKSIHLAVATVHTGNALIEKEIDDVTYYALPLNGKNKSKYCSDFEQVWEKIANSFKPDIVHIHGSEFPYGLAYVKACGNHNVVVSIQGLLSVISRYYTLGIDVKLARKCLTFRDIVLRDFFIRGATSFTKRGKYEIELIKRVDYVIGRTEWDKSQVWAINPKAKYFFCGETLRDSFYAHKWNYKNCIPHSIFISQANYSIKGLHILLQSLPLILREFPDTRLYIAGANVTNLPWWKTPGYGKYIKKLIKRLNLEGKLVFLGALSEQEMCDCFLKANVFVCPSSIENSPNSLGEAQVVGVPYVASYVGGIPDIVAGNEKALYRFEEKEMLAKKICQIFSEGKDYKVIPTNLERYNGDINAKTIIKIYKDIYQSEDK